MVATINVKKLRETHASIIDRRKARLEKAEAENRDLTAEELTADDADGVECSTLANRIKRAEAMFKAESELGAPVDQPSDDAPRDDPDSPHDVNVIPRFQTHPMKNFPNTREGQIAAYRSGMWAKASLFGDAKAAEWCRQNGIKNTMTEGSNTAGGVLVIPDFQRAVIDLRDLYGSFRRNVTVRPMSSDQQMVPVVTSGLTGYWLGETDAPTASDKAWSQVEVIARTLGALTSWSRDLEDDAIISMVDDLAGEVGRAFAYAEDQAGWLGDGTSTYGHTNGLATKIADGTHTASIYTALTGNTAFSTLDMEDFLGVVAALPEYAHQAGPKWYITRPGFGASMQRLALASGGTTASDVAGGVQQQFLGYPVEFVNVLNRTLTAQTSTIIAYFGSLPLAAVIGDRRQMTIESSRELYFTTRKVALMGYQRIGINVHSLGDTSVAGPIIALKTPAS